jgi:hypothetical protein
VGSIPIARSINPDDSVDLTRLNLLDSIYIWPVVGRYIIQLDGCSSPIAYPDPNEPLAESYAVPESVKTEGVGILILIDSPSGNSP